MIRVRGNSLEPGGVLPCVASHLATEGLASRSSALQDKVQTNRDGKSANGDLFKMSIGVNAAN